jgi:activator of HSP90 ATPase
MSETEKLKRKIQQRSNKQTLKEHLEDKKAHPVKKKVKTKKRARSEGDAEVKQPKAAKATTTKKKVAVKFKDETESSAGSDVQLPKPDEKKRGYDGALVPANSSLKETSNYRGKKGGKESDSADTHDSVSSIDDADVKSIMAACEVNH